MPVCIFTVHVDTMRHLGDIRGLFTDIPLTERSQTSRARGIACRHGFILARVRDAEDLGVTTTVRAPWRSPSRNDLTPKQHEGIGLGTNDQRPTTKCEQKKTSQVKHLKCVSQFVPGRSATMQPAALGCPGFGFISGALPHTG